EVFVVDATDSPERRQIALCQEIEMAEEGLHRWIKAVVFFELDCEALRKVAGTHPRRIECLQDTKHSFQFGNRRTELLRGLLEVTTEVTGLVDEIDEVLTNQALNGV